MSDDLEAQLRAVFREEARETLDALRVWLAARRKGAPGGYEASAAMRHAHNLKGAAASVGLEGASQAAHAFEDCVLLLEGASPESRVATLALLDDAITVLEDAAEGRGEAGAWAVRDRLHAQAGVLRGSGGEAKEADPVSDAQVRIEDDPAADAGPESATETVRSADGSVRVAAARLDRLFGFVSELLGTGTAMGRRQEALEAARAAIHEAVHATGVGEHLAVRSALRALDAQIEDHYRAAGAFGRLSSGISHAMRRVRMVRLETLAAQLRRTAAAASRDASKPIDLELRLGDIELDRVVLDALRDALTHLLRNAVDHGIEDAESRDVIGKPERGLIRVQASVLGSTVAISVADDGAGIDPDELLERLVEKGLVAANDVERPDDAELLDFLFHEGFSTRARATSLSGRGVGLDVVRRAVVALGGSVRVVARGPLGGAAFHLRVPLSLLSTGLLLVRASEVVYGIPVHAVDRVARVPREQVQTLEGAHVVTLPGRDPMRVHMLARMLGGRPAREHEHMHVVVLSVGEGSLAVEVDEVLRDQDLVVHGLPWNLREVPGVSGAVAMPDGNVVVVVDVNYLFTRRTVLGDVAAQGPVRSRVLVVDDSMTTRTLHRNVLVGAGYEVVLAADGDEAWRLLLEQPVDAVVSDVQMPGVDGFELTRRVRNDARLGSVPVVLVTSLARTDDVQRGLSAGADEYVVKGPLEQDALLAAVKRHVG